MKVAVVTGSAKGLGREIAKFLASSGYTLVIHYFHSKKEAEETLAEVRKDASASIIVKGDLTCEEEAVRVFEQISGKFGRIDLLVNNVGNFLYKPFGETTNSEFRDLVESNVYSTLYCSRAVLPSMRKFKNGQIINIGAVGCERITIRGNSTPYFLAKTGVYVITKIMASEEAEFGIRINMISPASLRGDIFKPSDFPSGRPAAYSDVIEALRFLISPATSYINGANIEVAGGFVPGIR